MTRNIILVVVAACLFFSCSNDSIIGSDLLNDESLNLEFVDLTPLPMNTVVEEAFPVFIIGTLSTSDLRTYPLGRIDEPIFGMSKTTVFVDIHKGVATPDFSDSDLDSIVLVLPYDTLGQYGNSNASHLIEVFELTENFGDRDTFYTNTAFEYDPMALASVDLIPNTVDTVYAYEPSADSITDFIPHLRIKMNEPFATTFFENSNGIEDDTNFVKDNFGFAITSTPSDNSFFGLNLSNSSLDQRELAVYYTQGDTAQLRYDFPLAANRSFLSSIDYAGSEVETALTDPSISDSLLYVQGLEGVNVELDLSAIDDLNDVSLNIAELVFFMAEIPGDDRDLYPPVDQFVLTYTTDDGNTALVSDYSLSLNTTDSFFGGDIEEDANGLFKYTLGITSHVLNILNGDIASKKLTLRPLQREQEANRTILYGPKHSQYPAKLRFVITTN